MELAYTDNTRHQCHKEARVTGKSSLEPQMNPPPFFKSECGRGRGLEC